MWTTEAPTFPDPIFGTFILFWFINVDIKEIHLYAFALLFRTALMLRKQTMNNTEAPTAMNCLNYQWMLISAPSFFNFWNHSFGEDNFISIYVHCKINEELCHDWKPLMAMTDFYLPL